MATDKKLSLKDADQTLRSSYNEINDTVSVDSFIVGFVGRRVTQTISTTTIADDTATFDFFQNSTELLYTIRVIYTDGTREELLEAERTA